MSEIYNGGVYSRRVKVTLVDNHMTTILCNIGIS